MSFDGTIGGVDFQPLPPAGKYVRTDLPNGEPQRGTLHVKSQISLEPSSNDSIMIRYDQWDKDSDTEEITQNSAWLVLRGPDATTMAHTTVLHRLGLIKDLLETESSFKALQRGQS